MLEYFHTISSLHCLTSFARLRLVSCEQQPFNFSHLKEMTLQMDRACPFCARKYKGLGNHLPYCPKREGRDYSSYLSQKTLNKKTTTKKQQCQRCGKWMKRLDTHLRLSASCKQISSMVYPTLVTITPSPPPVGASLTEDLGQLSFSFAAAIQCSYDRSGMVSS